MHQRLLPQLYGSDMCICGGACGYQHLSSRTILIYVPFFGSRHSAVCCCCCRLAVALFVFFFISCRCNVWWSDVFIRLQSFLLLPVLPRPRNKRPSHMYYTHWCWSGGDQSHEDVGDPPKGCHPRDSECAWH